MLDAIRYHAIHSMHGFFFSFKKKERIVSFGYFVFFFYQIVFCILQVVLACDFREEEKSDSSTSNNR